MMGTNAANKITGSGPGPSFLLPRLPGVFDFTSPPASAMKICGNAGVKQQDF